MTRIDLEIIVPVRDEAASLERFARRTLDSFEGLGQASARLLFVVDRSRDETAAVADSLVQRHPQAVSVLHRGSSTGLGRAYLAGFERVLGSPGASVIGQMDADLSHDPAELPAMLRMLVQQQADAVIGSRYVEGGRVDPDWGLHRKLLSRAANRGVVPAVLRLRVRDATSGYRLWRREALLTIDPVRRVRSIGYGFQVEMAFLAERAGLRIVEWPIEFREREQGRSKMTLAVKLRAMAEIVAIALRHRGVRP